MTDARPEERLHALLTPRAKELASAWADEVDRLGIFPGAPLATHQAMARELLPHVLAGLRSSDLASLSRVARTPRPGQQPPSSTDGLRAMMALRAPLHELVVRAAAPDDLRQLASVADGLVDHVCATVIDDFVGEREHLAEQQAQLLLELSTPVVQVWDDILVLPLVGTLDTVRAKQVIENLLDKIVRHQARAAILDVTGVSTIDSHVARHLIKTVRAARMLGAKVVLTGISPHTSQTIVKLGVDLSRVLTCGSLQSGLMMCYQLTGKTIVHDASSPASAEKTAPGEARR